MGHSRRDHAGLVLGGIAIIIALVAIAQLIVDPSAAEAEGGFIQGLVFIIVLLVLGAIQTGNGLALLRRNRLARPVLAGAVSIVGIPALLVVVFNLWLTLSRGGKKAVENYMAREIG